MVDAYDGLAIYWQSIGYLLAIYWQSIGNLCIVSVDNECQPSIPTVDADHHAVPLTGIATSLCCTRRHHR